VLIFGNFQFKELALKAKECTLDCENYREKIFVFIVYIYVTQLEGVLGKEDKAPQSKNQGKRVGGQSSDNTKIASFICWGFNFRRQIRNQPT